MLIVNNISKTYKVNSMADLRVHANSVSDMLLDIINIMELIST